MTFEHESIARADRHATAIGGSFIVANVSLGHRGVRSGSIGQRRAADKIGKGRVGRWEHRKQFKEVANGD